MGQHEVGIVGNESARGGLCADEGGPETAERGSRRMGARARAGRPFPGCETVSLRAFLRRLAAPLKRTAYEQDLDEEVAAHLELAERDGILRGLSATEAR